MNKFILLAALAALPVLGVLFSTPVFANSPGQLQNRADFYEVKNITTKGAYAQTANATCDETVKYSILVANSDYGLLSDVTVNANMQSGVINVSAKNVNGETTAVSGSAKVTVAKGTLGYVAGSTVRIDGGTSTSKADGVTAGGVNIGELKGSTQTFVQFQAKVNCPVEPKNIQVCELATKKTITIREDQFDATKHSMNPEDCKEVVKYIKVCELSTKNIITIDEKAYDAKKHSKNLADCAPKPPVVGEIVVCEIATKKIVTIKENAFDSSKHTKDLSKCAAAPVVVTPVTPTELPRTGATGVIALVASVIAAAAGYVVTSRKNVLG